ncbi:MAG: SLBB domain-containing protein [Terriglobia bacterium]
MRNRLFIGSPAIMDDCPPAAPVRTPRWVLMGVFFISLLGFAGTPAVPAQEQEQGQPERQQRQERPEQQQQQGQERPRQQERLQRQERVADWATDNLDMVAATTAQIREVLAKDPGLMVELKRLMAKQAIEKGQIVAEKDLEDDAILDRLTTDIRFRALATRLLQRYGYLSPELNPLSPSGKEQDLMMRARAERLARGTPAETVLSAGLRPSQAECEQEKGNPACVMETSNPATGIWPESEGPEATCEPGDDSVPCQAPANRPAQPSYPSRPETPGTETPAPDIQRPDLTNSPLMTASAVSTSGGGRTTTQPGGLRSEELGDVTGGIPAVLPENPTRQSSRPLASVRQPKAGVIPEPVEMVSSPNPYAYLPSLYDLYMQAAPRTGRLERFGLDVFRRDRRSVGIPMDLPAGPDYVLGPGDGLTIDLWGGVSQRLFRTVDREGRLSLPESGPLLVSGKTLGEVQEVVQRILRTQYRDVSADLSLARLRTVRVYVVGEVISPGAYDISSLSTPLNALIAAGGITSRGSLRHLRHSRGQQLVEEVDAYDLLLHGIRGDMKNLENGDTLLVPPVGPQVTVDGMVRRPAIYELRGETNLQEALDLAGGVLPAAALRHIEVQRLEAHETRTMLSVNVDETSDPEAVRRQLATFAVRDGDEVHIFPIAPYNTTAVYLQGHVLRPGRYAYTPGMRLTDLVASYQDLLPEPAEHYAEIVSLRQPDWRPVVESFDLAAALANPQASPKLAPLDTVRILGRYDVESAPIFWLSGEVRSPGQYRTSGQMHLRDAIYQGGGLLADASLNSAQLFRAQPDGSLKILNVNLAAALDADPLENVLVQPRDRIIVHRSQYRVDPPSVYIRGEVANPGRYPLGENMRVADLLLAAGGPKRSADLTNGDLTRYFPVTGSAHRGERQSVNLAAAFHDARQNFPLKDGDVLSVPELPGWKDLGASITVKGEVKNPGVYGIRPGERLSSVLRRAGGLLPTAYAQGAVFTRTSVRELQEKSRQELIQRLEQEGASVKTSLQTTGSEQAQLAAEAAQQQQRVLDALRRAPTTGRLVIRLHPGLKGFENSSQDIEVRDGDNLEIPKQPGVVLVIGQVYNTNAITYVGGKNAGWYLSQSGGATRLADKGAIFIVRADGEITSRHQGGWWSTNVLSAAVRPGDTIVVPERTILGDTRWKNVIAIAQIASAAAITAAVIP